MFTLILKFFLQQGFSKDTYRQGKAVTFILELALSSSDPWPLKWFHGLSEASFFLLVPEFGGTLMASPDGLNQSDTRRKHTHIHTERKKSSI